MRMLDDPPGISIRFGAILPARKPTLSVYIQYVSKLPAGSRSTGSSSTEAK
jgi:hypothetical protein